MYEYHDDHMGVMFVLAVLFFMAMMTALVGFAVWKIVATRRLAQRNGASDADATTLAVFGGQVGTAAAYLKPVVATTGPATREDLITEVRDLEAKGLITPEQAERRVDEILRA